MNGKLDKRFGATDEATDWRTVRDALDHADAWREKYGGEWDFPNDDLPPHVICGVLAALTAAASPQIAQK